MPKRLGLGLLLGAGLAGTAWAQSAAEFDGHYRGELTLTKITAGDCTEPPEGALYPLTITGGAVQFPFLPRFATTLRGRIDKSGAFTASARLRSGVVRMTGQVQGERLTADIVSPSCNYRFHSVSID
jgi:hypothetical protein